MTSCMILFLLFQDVGRVQGDLSFYGFVFFQETQFGVGTRPNLDDVKVRDLRGDGDPLRPVYGCRFSIFSNAGRRGGRGNALA